MILSIINSFYTLRTTETTIIQNEGENYTCFANETWSVDDGINRVIGLNPIIHEFKKAPTSLQDNYSTWTRLK